MSSNLSRNERREAVARKHAGPDFYVDDLEPGDAPALRLFQVTPVCGGRQVGQPIQVRGTDRMTVAADHRTWAGLVSWGAHPQVTELDADGKPVPQEQAEAEDVLSDLEARERDELHRAIQDETQLALGRGW